MDLNRLGAVVTKGVANVPWPGNPTPRIAEVYGGMLNAIGLQNPGIDVFVKRDIPFLKQYDTKIIVNVCGKTTEDYCEVVERLADEPVDMLEINISCPNVKEGGIAFGQDPKAVEAITRAGEGTCKTAHHHEAEPQCDGYHSDGARRRRPAARMPISLINTLTGMKIDVHRRTFAAGQQDRRHVRPGREAGGCAHGVPGGPGSEGAHHRHGRHSERRRTPWNSFWQVPAAVSVGTANFRRSAGDGEDHRKALRPI